MSRPHTDPPTQPLHNNLSSATRFLKAAVAVNAPLVVVTGGLSYLGSHVVARMLAKGYYVRTIVPQGANVNFLLQLNGANHRLQIIPVRDPSAPDALSSMLLAFRGVSTVVHAASFSTHNGKLSKHIASKRIVSALKIALDAASAPGNVVTNFIYLSSEMAVYDPSKHSRRTHVQLTENDWFDCSNMNRETKNAFAFAYTVAEMRLWARVGKGSLPFNVCSIIPSFLFGPALSTRHISSAPILSFFHSAALGKFDNVPDVPMSPVDVRDVARAITALTERPDVGGRILLNAESLTCSELLHKVKNTFPSYRWPECSRPGLIPRRSVTSGDPEARRILKDADFASKERWGRQYSFSQTRARVELGLTFRPVDATIRDTILSLVRFNQLEEFPDAVDK